MNRLLVLLALSAFAGACAGAKPGGVARGTAPAPTASANPARPAHLDCSWDEWRSFDQRRSKPSAQPSSLPPNDERARDVAREKAAATRAGGSGRGKIRRAVVWGDALVFADVEGAMFSVGLKDGPLGAIETPDAVQDLIQRDDAVLVLTRSDSDAYAHQRVWRWTPGHWSLEGDLEVPSCFLSSALATAGSKVVVLGRPGTALVRDEGRTWQRLDLPRWPAFTPPTFACSHDGLCFFGANHGEFGGFLAFIDLPGRKAGSAAWPTANDGLCSNRINAAMADPQRADCVLVAAGYAHRSSAVGCVVRACRTGAERLFDVPEPNEWNPDNTAPAQSVARSLNGFYALTRSGLYEVTKAGARPVPMPELRAVDDVRLSTEVPGVVIVDASAPGSPQTRIGSYLLVAHAAAWATPIAASKAATTIGPVDAAPSSPLRQRSENRVRCRTRSTQSVPSPPAQRSRT
jgi:hypothetical protein